MEKQVLHMEKPKAVPVINSIGEENDRETQEQIAKQMEKNPNIDPTRTHLNRDLIEGIDHSLKLNERVNKRIAEGYTSKRKIRTDAVRVVDGVYGASSKFFDGMSTEEIYKFGSDFAEFLKQKVGKDNIVGCRIHLDEKAGKNEAGKDLYHVHIHFQFVPLKDGKLVRREFGISQNGLKYWHSECAKWMQERGWQLERGVERQEWEKPVEHLQPNEFKRKHYSDNVPSVKLEKALREIDNHVDISTPMFAEMRGKEATAEMSEKHYRMLRDIAGQVVTLRRRVEALEPLEKEREQMRKTYAKYKKNIDDACKGLAKILQELDNENEQAKYKKMQAELQDIKKRITDKEKELDRTLKEIRNNQKSATEIADGLIDKALEGEKVKRERWEQMCVNNALVAIKRDNPAQYNELVEMGRKIATKDMHARQQEQSRNRRTSPQHTRQ